MQRNISKKFSLRKKICLVIIIFYFIIALFAPIIMPYSANDFSHPSLVKPSAKYIFGTDEMGHDIFSLLIHGFRATVCMALLSGFCSTLLGTVLAFLAAYFGKTVDCFLTIVADLFIVIPEMVIIMFVAVFATPTVTNTVLAIVFFSWPRVFKMIRDKLKDCMSSSKVQYTLMMKGNVLDVLKKLFPDVLPSIRTYFVLQTNKSVTYETTLAFFGIGDPLAKTWGKLIRSAMDYENLYYDNTFLWYLMPAITVVVIFVVCLALLVREE